MSAAETVTINLGFARVECCSCGVLFYIPSNFERHRRDDGKSFWCPCCGTSLSWRGRTTIDDLKQQLESEKKRTEWARQDARVARERADHHEHRARAYKGHLTRTRKRVASGVCPCCTRSFKNLARHMLSQHPEYAVTEDPA